MTFSLCSKEPLRFLEIHYRGADEGKKPHGLVGKGKWDSESSC